MPITTPTAGLSFSSLWAVPTTLAILIRTTSIPRQLPLSCLRRWSPFAELLFGGRKVSYEVDHPEPENVAWRLINIQYTHSWMGGVDHNHPDNGFRITTEVVLRVGTW